MSGKNCAMIKNYERAVMKAVALCFKPYLKPEEAMIYCNLGSTRFSSKCAEFGIYKNDSGYFRKEDLDRMLSGQKSTVDVREWQVKMKFR